MRFHTATIGVLVGLASDVGLLALYSWLSGGEIQENRYDGYREAQASIDRGWLPLALPRSAIQIHEWHDLDTNERFGSFHFNAGERTDFESVLQPGIRPPIRIDRDPSFASNLPLDPAEEQLRNAGFWFYADQDFGFAINWSTGMAYFWGTSA